MLEKWETVVLGALIVENNLRQVTSPFALVQPQVSTNWALWYGREVLHIADGLSFGIWGPILEYSYILCYISPQEFEFFLQHAYTATIISRPPAYKGTEVIINVWQPFVEPSDFSLAQLWVMNTGLSNPPGSVDWALNTMEAGWQVSWT